MIGHAGPWSEWVQAMEQGRVHHAWMLAGPRGIGKQHFAMRAALNLVGHHGNASSEQQHPDIVVLRNLPKDEKEDRKREEGKPFETKRNISVAQIREMQRRLTTRPTMGDHRAIIIDAADDLEKSAANALLKSLEEPPESTRFLLIAHRPAKLLPTIRSRCRVLRFASIPDDEMRVFLSGRMPNSDQDTIDAAIVAAAGSPGAALDFVQQDLAPVAVLMHNIATTGDQDFRLRGSLAEVIGTRPDRERLRAILDLSRAMLSARLSDEDQIADAATVSRMIEAHSALVRLGNEAPTFNYDPAMLIMEIGTLLASASPHRKRIDA